MRIWLERACRGDHQSPERLAAVHEGEHRSYQYECEDTERSEEVALEEGALSAKSAGEEHRGMGSKRSLISWMAYKLATRIGVHRLSSLRE